jgi:hypothetical protein
LTRANGRLNPYAASGMPLHLVLENIGGRTRARTWDPLIKSYIRQIF